MPFSFFQSSKRNSKSLERKEQGAFHNSPREVVFHQYFSSEDSYSSFSGESPLSPSSPASSLSPSSSHRSSLSSHSAASSKVKAGNDANRSKSFQVENKNPSPTKGFFKSRSHKEGPFVPSLDPHIPTSGSAASAVAHSTTRMGKPIMSPELAARLLNNQTFKKSARLKDKDAWITSIANDESFFTTLLKLPNEEKALSDTLLKYFFMAHNFVIESHSLLAFLFNHYYEEAQTPERKERILDLLKLWISTSREDFVKIEVNFLFSNWHSLLHSSPLPSEVSKAIELKKTFENQIQEDYEPEVAKELSEKEYDKKFNSKNIWDKVSELHLALQISLLDSHYFKKVNISDLLQTDYTNHPDSTLVPLKNHFIKMVLWIANEIVSRPKKRTHLVAKILRVGQIFLQLRNLNGVAMIYQALMLPCVARLHKTWKRLVDSPEEKIWTEISLLMERDVDGSFSWLNRKMRKSCQEFFIPPFHILMNELEEQAGVNGSVGLLNLPQVWRVGSILDYFQRNQNVKFCVRRDDKIQNFLHEMTVSNNLGKMWEMSKEVDPTPVNTPSLQIEKKLWYYSNVSKEDVQLLLQSAPCKSFIVWPDQFGYTLSYSMDKITVEHHKIESKAPSGESRSRQSVWTVLGCENTSLTTLILHCHQLYDMKPILASSSPSSKGKLLANTYQLEEEYWNRSKAFGFTDRFFSINAELTDKDQEILRTEAEFAVLSCDFESLAMLIGAGLPMDTVFEGKMTLLHVAAEHNLPRLVDLIMDYNARYWNGKLEINSIDEIGWTPLHIAAGKHHLQVLKALLTHGARVSCLNNSGASPLHYVVRKKPDPSNTKAQEEYTAILNMLIERGATLNSQDYNLDTPLHNAISNSNEVATKILLRKGALNLKNKRGDSSRSLAKKKENEEGEPKEKEELNWNCSNPSMQDILLITNGSKMEKFGDVKPLKSEVEQYLKQDLKRGAMPYDHYFSSEEHDNLVGMDHERGVVIISITKGSASTKVLLRTKKGEEFFVLEKIAPISSLQNSLNDFLPGLDFKMFDGNSFAETMVKSESDLHANATSVSILYIKDAFNLPLILSDTREPSVDFQKFVRTMAGTRTRAQSFGPGLIMSGNAMEEKGMSAYAMVSSHPHQTHLNVVFYNLTAIPPEDRISQLNETSVMVVFLEANNIDTSMLLNQFAQTVIVVKPSTSENENGEVETEYRLGVVSRSTFGSYEPALPFPPIFNLNTQFKSYLFDKLINACVLSSSAGFSYSSEEFRDRVLFELYSFCKNKQAETTAAQAFSNVPKHKLYKVYPSKIVGSGATSMVYAALNRQTKREFCAKIVDKNAISKEEASAADKEVSILTEMCHPNVIKLIDSYTVDSCLYLVLDLCRGGSLSEDVEQNGVFSEKQASNVMEQTMEALAYIHSRKISHRDLKPQNILYGDTTRKIIKIIDFGYGKNTRQGMNHSIAGTEEFMAPEVWKRDYDYFKIDIFSLGCVLYYLLFGKSPLALGEGAKVLWANLAANRFPTPISNEGASFLSRLLDERYESRPTAEEALLDPWFVQFRN